MPKGFNLRCAAGKTARVSLGAHTPGQALVLLSIQESETDDSPITYRAPVPGADRRQHRALLDTRDETRRDPLCVGMRAGAKPHRPESRRESAFFDDDLMGKFWALPPGLRN
jgi:hypothetical protein